MTQEEKQLLLKDLCARLPYGINVHHRGSIEEISEISPEGEFKNRRYDAWFGIETCKPYLRPMSSMTGAEVLEYISLKENIIAIDDITYYFETYESIDWLNKHHFDYRGLIEKGLALKALEGMYELKKEN